MNSPASQVKTLQFGGSQLLSKVAGLREGGTGFELILHLTYTTPPPSVAPCKERVGKECEDWRLWRGTWTCLPLLCGDRKGCETSIQTRDIPPVEWKNRNQCLTMSLRDWRATQHVDLAPGRWTSPSSLNHIYPGLASLDKMMPLGPKEQF